MYMKDKIIAKLTFPKKKTNTKSNTLYKNIVLHYPSKEKLYINSKITLFQKKSITTYGINNNNHKSNDNCLFKTIQSTSVTKQSSTLTKPSLFINHISSRNKKPFTSYQPKTFQTMNQLNKLNKHSQKNKVNHTQHATTIVKEIQQSNHKDDSGILAYDDVKDIIIYNDMSRIRKGDNNLFTKEERKQFKKENMNKYLEYFFTSNTISSRSPSTNDSS